MIKELDKIEKRGLEETELEIIPGCTLAGISSMSTVCVHLCERSANK